MGRKSSFQDRVIFAAAGSEISRKGTFTLQNLSALTGVSIGSLYHRYTSREGLLAAAWYDAVGRFQSGFLDALRNATLETGRSAALATPRFCRADRDAAIILACCRQAEFLTQETPHDLARKIAAVNEEAAGEIVKFSKRIDRPLINCRLALVAYPLAAVTLFLPEKPVPKSIDDEISAAYDAAMRG